MTLSRLAVFALLIVPLLSPVVTSGGGSHSDLKIVEVYYSGQEGFDYIVIENWGEEKELSDHYLDDGEGIITLPNITLEKSQRLVLAEDEDAYLSIWQTEPDYTWAEQDTNFNLAQLGDDLLLCQGDMVIDSFLYGEGELEGWKGDGTEILTKGHFAKRNAIDTDTKWDWNRNRNWRVGQSSFETKTFTSHNSTVYTSPDCSHAAFSDYLDNVKNNLAICVYEITSPSLTNKLVNLSDSGIDIKLLVEGTPVSGLSNNEIYCLNKLQDNNVTVRLIGKDQYSPYNYVHSKYMVADNRSVLISSENFGNTGYPKNPTGGNRGWGAYFNSRKAADHYSDIFSWDWFYADTYNLKNVDNTDEDIYPTYKPSFSSKNVKSKVKITPVLAPDNSISNETILGLIDDAEEEIKVEQFYAYEWNNRTNPYLQALVDAARRDIDVKILLDSTWYNVQENDTDNDDTLRRLNSLARNESLDLEVRLIDDCHGLTKVHNKGMVVDEEKVLISSINWNENSVLNNREVGVILENKEIGRYYTRIFKRDWKNDITPPIADAGRDRTVKKGKVTKFTGIYSWDDGNISEYRWDLDDDGIYEESGENVSKVFRETGEYKVKLKVYDEEGNVDVDEAVIQVEEQDFSLGIDVEEKNRTPMALILSIVLVSSFLFIYWFKYRG